MYHTSICCRHVVGVWESKNYDHDLCDVIDTLEQEASDGRWPGKS
jgi:hypothetical protein